MPSAFAASTALTASAEPWRRARRYLPSLPGFGRMVSSSPYRGKRVLQEACGPRVIGSRRQPLRSWVLIQSWVRFGWERQARESPEM